MAKINKPIFIDTNILLRYLITSFPEHGQVKQSVEILIKHGYTLWVSRQIIREFGMVCTRPQTFMQMMTSYDTTLYMMRVMNIFEIADETATVTQNLISLMQKIPVGGKQVHDTNIVATMRANQIQDLFTLNIADFKRFEPLITLISLTDILQMG